MKTLTALLSGYILWTVLWFAGNAGLRAAGVLPGNATQPLAAPRPLVALLLVALVCSLAGGYITAAISRSSSTLTIPVLGFLLFATGCIVQYKVWNLMPFWYHLVFLGLLIPTTLLGAVVRSH
jgi:hypothetical protein